ncbi:AAA family ATPase [Paenibacillus sp. GCM10027626]|uniref:AAA family ATPase n=1 Tax=Paenibacillus sp. GCM10027626 TaxID=3273411 RepID=UPI003642E89B
MNRKPSQQTLNSLTILLEGNPISSETTFETSKLEQTETCADAAQGPDAPYRSFDKQGRLYGREHEISLLSLAFQSTCFGSAEIVYVSGAAGIGKTSLLEEVFRGEQQHPRKPVYLAGKFEQIPKDSPYYPIVQAFRGLMRHLLGASSDQVEAWGKKLRAALRSNEAVIAELIPEVKLLIGDTAAAWELPPDEVKMRFIYAFRKFVQVLATKEHPLVLFIDDLQWADESSLQLLHFLMSDPESQYVMFVGAYRDGEIQRSKLPGCLGDGSVEAEVNVRHIRLRELTLDQMNLLVRDALCCDADEAMLLTEVLYPQSGGNPFHYKQIFQRLLDDHLLTYDAGGRKWQWNLEDMFIRESQFDVNDLVVRKLMRLSGQVQDTLQVAACLGSEFEPLWIADVTGRTAAEIWVNLCAAADEGFIMPLDPDKFRFLHDSIQKTMYSRMDEETRRQTHLAIGRQLKEAVIERPERLFEAVNHLNIGSSGIHAEQELHELIGMNLDAGTRAKASAAYDIALLYFRKGVELLPADAWYLQFDLCFELHAECAECEYLCGNHEDTEQLVDYLLCKARNAIERARVQRIRITQCINLGKYAEATMLGLNSLKEFHIHVSPAPTKATIITEVLRVEALLRNRIHRLADLPQMTDKNRIAAIHTIFSIVSSTFFTNKKVFFLLVCKAVQLSLKYGNTPVSAAVYSAYGMFVGIALGKYVRGYELAKVGLELSERYDVPSIKSKTHVMFGGVLCQFAGSANEGDVYLEKALRFGMEAGDYVFSSYAMGAHVNSLYARAPLNVLSRVIAAYMTVLAETKDEFVLQNFYLYRQFQLALQGETEEPCSFESPEFAEQRFLEHIGSEETYATTLFQYNTYKVQLCYLNGKYEEAIHWAKEAEAYKSYATHLPHLPECLYYESLAILSANSTDLHMGKRRKRLKNNLRRFKTWAKCSPGNFLAKMLVIEAELAQATKRFSLAEAGYDRAIREAREQDDIQVESIACELAGRYYASLGKEKLAIRYLQTAYEGYERWGARLKARQLADWLASLGGGIREVKTPLVDERPKAGHSASASESYAAGDLGEASAMDGLDLAAILKAAQAMTDKMDLDAVLAEIMGTLMNYAGARKGVLLTDNGGELYVQVWADAEVHVLDEPAPLEDDELLPGGIARYAARTQEPVHYAGEEDSWLYHSTYMAKHRPQSALCLPVIVHGAPVGVLYLENPAPGVFLPERINILRALASQGGYICELLRSLSQHDGESDEDKDMGTIPAGIEEPLTDREMEVLALLAAGLSNKEIAERLVIAVGTVKVHVKNIFAKLKVNRRTKAIAQAKELQLLK